MLFLCRKMQGRAKLKPNNQLNQQRHESRNSIVDSSRLIGVCSDRHTSGFPATLTGPGLFNQILHVRLPVIASIPHHCARQEKHSTCKILFALVGKSAVSIMTALSTLRGSRQTNRLLLHSTVLISGKSFLSDLSVVLKCPDV